METLRQQQDIVRQPRPPVPGWDGVERRSGVDRRSGKDRRNFVNSAVHIIYYWIIGKPNQRHGEDRRAPHKDRRYRLRPY